MKSGPARIGSLSVMLGLLLAVAVAIPASAEVSVARVGSAETYALSLLNCTRTGGWVEADGSCSDRGSGAHSDYRKPLPRHSGISRKVAWRWARALVNKNVCGHVIAGRPELGARLARRGFRFSYYGENVGCGWGYGSANDVILATHLAMQAEQSYGGGHWQNMKNTSYKSVGIGVATGNGTTMVVYDFYGKRP